MSRVFTIGYQGRDIEGFIATLRANDVRYLIDVRDYPLSRKKGFSKTPLTGACHAAGIRYLHFKKAGNPKPIRDHFVRRGDIPGALRAYKTHIANKTDIIEELYRIIAQDTVCLMCFEEQADACHRSVLLAQVMKFNGAEFTVVNL